MGRMGLIHLHLITASSPAHSNSKGKRQTRNLKLILRISKMCTFGSNLMSYGPLEPQMAREKEKRKVRLGQNEAC